MLRLVNLRSGVWARLRVRLALVLLSAALLLNTAAIYLVVRDRQLIDIWLTRPDVAPASLVLTLEPEFDLRIASRLIVSAILIFGVMVILTIQKTLKRVRLVAADVFARMDKGVIAVDRRRTITVVNPAAARILTLAGDHVGEPLSGISSADIPLAQMVEVAEGDPSGRERDFVLERDGRTRWIRSEAHVLRDAAGEMLGCIIMLNDVTRRHLDEQRLQRIERFHSLGALAS
jgi:PAS domain S-box-containing protein